MNKKSMSAKELTTYSYKEVLEKSTAYFNGDDLAASTWANKYAMKNEKGEFI
jgi:ribonucleoside-diphosphate reductase alpha chain